MFPRRQRVPSADLKERRGHVLGRSPSFILAARENGLAYARFAVIVGAKTAASAVRRHALKRRAADVLLGIGREGQDLILTVLPPASGLPAEKFREELRSLVGRA